MRCAFTPLAEADLEEIGDYIAKDNPERAITFIRELRERCEKIVHMPRAAPLRPELGEGVRIVTFGRYVICYSEREEQIVIERIVHGARRFERLLWKRADLERVAGASASRLGEKGAIRLAKSHERRDQGEPP